MNEFPVKNLYTRKFLIYPFFPKIIYTYMKNKNKIIVKPMYSSLPTKCHSINTLF